MDVGVKQRKKPVAHPWFLDWVTQVMPFPKTDREEIRFRQEVGGMVRCGWGEGTDEFNF